MAGTGLGDLKSYPNTCASFIGQYPSPEFLGLQIWHGLGVLERLKIKCPYLEWGWVYKPCLERGRWLNCGWNGIRGSKIVYPNTCTSLLVSIPHRNTPGLQIRHGLGVLESKTHNFYMHFLFKQTYIQIINIFHCLNLFVYYIGKNGVENIFVNTLIRNYTSERSIIGSK